MATKRIHNPTTGKYYKIRERTSKYGKPGQIKGLWSPSKKTVKPVSSKRDYDPYDDYWGEGPCFANEGSALRCATKKNPRNLPCPTCGEPNRLTPADVAHHYQCDECADRAEGKYGEY